MSISLRKALPLSLLLLVCLCLFLLPTAHADGLEDLVNAVERQDESFTVTEDMTIPEGVHLQAWDTAITVQKGKTLTIQGNINTSELNINGTVTLENWGFLYASQISLGSAGRLNITGNNYMRTDYEQSKGLIGDGRINFGNTHNVLYMDVHTNSILEFNDAFNTLKTIQPEHFVGYLRVCNSMILDSGTVDMNSGKPVAMEIADGATLTVPTGTTLNAYEIYIEGSSGASTLEVNGKLYGNTEIRIREGGKLICANDSCFVSNGACIRLEQSGNPDTQIQGLNLNRFSRFDQGNDILFIDSDGLFAQFKAACQSGAQYFDLSNKGRFQISESITIPAGMTVDATGTDFIVPVGNSVTVNGKLILTGWNLNGQANSIVIPEGGELHIAAWRGLFISIWGAWVRDGSVERVTFAENAGVTLWAEVNNDQQLHDVFADFVEAIHNEHVDYEIRVAFPCTLSESAVIPGHIRMTMLKGLTVPENVTLTNNGTITALSDAVMTINGTLVNNNFVEMEKRTTTGAMLRVNGAYSGIGTIGIKDHGEVEGYISGIDLSNYEAVPDNIGTRFFYTGSLFPALKDAIARGESDFNMRNCGTVLFTESITIPNTTKVHGSGTEIVIPDGVTLTVENYCSAGTLTVQPGGHVTVSNVDGAHLTVRDALNYSNVNQFTVNRYMEIGAHLWREDLKKLNIGERGKLTVSSLVNNDSELAAALAGKPTFPNDKFQNRIGIRYNCTLAGDMIVDDFILTVEDSGSLTIPAGKTLMCLNRVEAQDAPIYLQGRMISVGYGQLSLGWEESAAALLDISEEGFYAGKEIHVHAPKDRRDACISGLDMSKVGKIINPDFTAYFPPIEVVLPDELTALGGEAFANDSFHTVYIPSGITSIAPDAFSGTDVAIIFGVVGSYAEEYAADSGIPFLRLPDWYDVHDQQFVIDYTA